MNNTVLASGYPIKVIIPTTGCWNSNHAVRYIEHVEVITSINYTIRGALQILLESPSGTTARLLSPRHLDESDRGFENWTFMSVMTWGEIAEGVWSLIISDTVSACCIQGDFEVELLISTVCIIQKNNIIFHMPLF
nr:unnamed protein product [Callosobruchus chinensis]